jgi:phosphate:Na+ symporter
MFRHSKLRWNSTADNTHMTDILFPFLGGVGLFLMGMSLLSQGLIAFSGNALKRGLVRFTGTPYKAFGTGALATAVVQSSSATTVTIIGFVSAGLISFSQAIGFVIGASLGNTATGWIVATLGLRVSLGYYTLPLIGIGAMLKLFSTGRGADLGIALVGFGLIFLGLDTLQQGMQGLATHYNLSGLPSGGMADNFLVMSIGLVMTLIMQSSTAAIATTLAAYHAAAINFDQAAALVVGAAIGTTVTGALVAIGATAPAKRTALANILFNLASGLIAILLLPGLIHVVNLMNIRFNLSPGAVSLAAFHTLFISVGVTLFLPFVPNMARLITRMVPERGQTLTQHLDDSLYAVPPVALEAVQRTVEHSAHELFLLYQHLLSGGYTSRIKTQTATLRAALEHTYEFLSHVHLPADNWTLAELRMAQLHVIDHQLRLCHRMERLERSPIDFASGVYHWAVQNNLDMLSLALDAKDSASSARLPDIEKQAASLEDMAHQVRNQVLQQNQESGTAPAQALQTTDAFRWLARSGHHVWRICHYLKQARDTTGNGKPASA